MSPLRRALAAILVPAALILGACGSDDSSSSSATTASTAKSAAAAGACAQPTPPLAGAGRLPVGTDTPASPPYFVDNTPSNGKGFESAVAYAIAKQLGFTPSEVTW